MFVSFLLLMFFISSVFLINWIAFGRNYSIRISRYLMIISVFSFFSTFIASVIYAGIYKNDIVYQISIFIAFGIPAIISIALFLFPLWRLTKTSQQISLTRHFGVILLCLVFPIGTAYIPMRAIGNGIDIRTFDENVQNELSGSGRFFANDDDIKKFQLEHMYQMAGDIEADCQVFLRNLSGFSQNTSSSIEINAYFWIDRALSHFYRVGELFGCSFTNLEPRNDYQTILVINFIYYIFLQCFFWAFVFTILQQFYNRIRSIKWVNKK